MTLRGIAAFLLMLGVLSASVFAVSMSGPSGLSDTVVFTGDGKPLTFMIRGDSANSQQVEFFVKSSSDVVDIDGDGMSYSQSYTLSQYQIVNPIVVLKGVKSGNATITYGVKYRQSTNGSGIGFEQVLQDTFQARVDCVSGVVCQGMNYTVVVNSDPVGASIYVDSVYRGVAPLNFTMKPDTYRFKATLSGYYDESVTRTVGGNQSFTISLAKVQATTKSSSGGSGGGGGYVAPKKNATVNTTVASVVAPVAPVSPVVAEQKVVESPSQGVVQDVPKESPVSATPVAGVVKAVSNAVATQGRPVFILLMGLLFTMLLINYSAVRVVKGADFL
jgi:hypothetical protein